MHILLHGAQIVQDNKANLKSEIKVSQIPTSNGTKILLVLSNDKFSKCSKGKLL